MLEFFKEGGWSMYPVLVCGIVLVVSALRYAVDREPARRPFITVMSFALLVFIVQGVVSGAATVCWALSGGHQFPADVNRVTIFLEGMKECSRPAILGLGLEGVALILLAVGVYRVGLRELRAVRG